MRTPKTPTISVARNSPNSRLLSKFNTRNSASTSLTHSSCSSLANISIGFKASQ